MGVRRAALLQNGGACRMSCGRWRKMKRTSIVSVLHCHEGERPEVAWDADDLKRQEVCAMPQVLGFRSVERGWCDMQGRIRWHTIVSQATRNRAQRAGWDAAGLGMGGPVGSLSCVYLACALTREVDACAITGRYSMTHADCWMALEGSAS